MAGDRDRWPRANGKTAILRRFCGALPPGFSSLAFLALQQTLNPTVWISKYSRGRPARSFESAHGIDRNLRITQSRCMQKTAARTLERECPISQTIDFPH